jgi:3-oxoacyl-[acyl-carrier-protein] synthase III
MAERQQQIVEAGDVFAPPAGLLRKLTGVEGVHLVADAHQTSDLAATAARKSLPQNGVAHTDIGLMTLHDVEKIYHKHVGTPATASSSQLGSAQETDVVGPGSLALPIRLAAGSSAGLMMLRL